MAKKRERTPDDWRDEMIDAVLAQVPFDGWTDRALAKAAEALGLERAYARLVFPGAAAEVLEAAARRADALMLEELEAAGIGEMRIRDRIRSAVMARLLVMDDHREAVERSMAYLALPQNGALALKLLYRTVDAMWVAAGDTATDYNFYTKRAILAGVYSSTLLIWLHDRSEGYADTRAFLDRRIDGVMQFEKVKAEVRKVTDNLPSIAGILGRLRYPAR